MAARSALAAVSSVWATKLQRTSAKPYPGRRHCAEAECRYRQAERRPPQPIDGSGRTPTQTQAGARGTEPDATAGTYGHDVSKRLQPDSRSLYGAYVGTCPDLRQRCA